MLPCEAETSRFSDVSPTYVTEVRVHANERSFGIYDFLTSKVRSEIVLRNVINADFVKDRGLSSGAL